MHVTKTPKAHQVEAIQSAVSRFEQGSRGQTLMGSTGAGKTLVAYSILEQVSAILSSKDTSGEPNGGNVGIAFVPPMGGTVTKQHMDELAALGMGSYTLDYHGDNRKQKLEEWKRRVATAPKGTLCILVTSPHLLHAEVRAEKKLNPAFSTADAISTVVRRLGSFDFMLFDEFQDHRNAGLPYDASKDIDPSKALYACINAVYEFSKRTNGMKFVIGLSATPCVNGSGDLYSFLRFIYNVPKVAIMNTTRRSSDEKMKALWDQTSSTIKDKYVIKIKTPPVPDTTKSTINHDVSAQEFALLKDAMTELSKLACALRNLWVKYRNNQHNEGIKNKLEIANMRYQAQYTRCRRGQTHVYFYEPAKRANPETHPMKDSKGNVVMRMDEEGKLMPVGKPLKIDAKAVADSYEPSTKFQSIMDYLSHITDERVMILFAFSGTCDLLAEYIRRRFEGREVYLYHGDVSNRASHLEKFQSGANDAILIGTRGALEKAVDVSATTTKRVFDHALGYHVNVRYATRQIFGDVALSYAEQQQAEGRTKRTIAQGWDDEPDRVRAWYCDESVAHTPGAFPTVEKFMREVIALKKSRCDHLMRTDDDCIEAEIESSKASYGSDQGSDERSVLTLIIDMMAPFVQGKKAVHTEDATCGRSGKRQAPIVTDRRVALRS